MTVYEEYKSKLRTPEEAVKVVKDGDWVDYSQTCSFPVLLDAALAARKDELKDVKVYNAISMRPVQVVEQDPEGKAFTFNAWHCSGLDRKYVDQGRAFYDPMRFQHNGMYYEKGYAPVDVAMVTVTPMDKHGYFSFGLTNCCQMELLRAAKTIIFEINEAMPYTYDLCNGHMHISEVDMVVEGPHDGLPQAPQPPVTEIDKQIAAHIFPYLRDGITLQIGIGGMPNSLGAMIAESDLKDLGMHTELMADGYLKLYEAGKITNMKKEINKGKGVFSICNGTTPLYEFLDHNIGIMTAPMAYVNDPAVIMQFDNFVSINGCIACDLYGQVSSESAGTRHISGTGGQLDFAIGASQAKNGLSFLAMNSSRVDKKTGVRVSNVKPHFTGGDIITTPRTQAQHIVTEYGVARVMGIPTWLRAEALINIAHPDCREELIKAAEEQKIWRKSNKR